MRQSAFYIAAVEVQFAQVDIRLNVIRIDFKRRGIRLNRFVKMPQSFVDQTEVVPVHGILRVGRCRLLSIDERIVVFFLSEQGSRQVIICNRILIGIAQRAAEEFFSFGIILLRAVQRTQFAQSVYVRRIYSQHFVV